MKELNTVNMRNANGLRKSPFTQLTEDDILKLKVDINAIKADESVFMFNDGLRTSYVDIEDVIYVKGDVLPDLEYSIHPRDIMSPRAVLAHEYYGHRANRFTAAKNGSWNDEFRASYLAAKNSPGLSEKDRMLLVMDACERAKDAYNSIKLNAFMRRILYGDDYANANQG